MAKSSRCDRAFSKMLFSGSPEGRYTLVPSFMEGTEITFSWVCFPWGKGKLFQDNCLATSFSEPWAGGMVGQLKTRGDKSVHEGEQVFFFWNNSQDELMLVKVAMGDQSRSLMAAWRSCQSAWVKCQTRRRWGGSLKWSLKYVPMECEYVYKVCKLKCEYIDSVLLWFCKTTCL